MIRVNEVKVLEDASEEKVTEFVIATERIYQQYRWGLKCVESDVFYEVAGGTYFDYAIYCRDYLNEAVSAATRGNNTVVNDNIRKIAALAVAAVELINIEPREDLFEIIGRFEPVRTLGDYSPEELVENGRGAVLFKLQELLQGSRLPDRQLFLEIAHLCMMYIPGNVKPRQFTTITNGRTGDIVTVKMQLKELDRYMNKDADHE